MSTSTVVLIELAPDSQRKITQIAPNGKRVAPLSWPMSLSALRGDTRNPVQVINIRETRLFSSVSDPGVARADVQMGEIPVRSPAAVTHRSLRDDGAARRNFTH